MCKQKNSTRNFWPRVRDWNKILVNDHNSSNIKKNTEAQITDNCFYGSITPKQFSQHAELFTSWTNFCPVSFAFRIFAKSSALALALVLVLSRLERSLASEYRSSTKQNIKQLLMAHVAWCRMIRLQTMASFLTFTSF